MIREFHVIVPSTLLDDYVSWAANEQLKHRPFDDESDIDDVAWDYQCTKYHGPRWHLFIAQPATERQAVLYKTFWGDHLVPQEVLDEGLARKARLAALHTGAPNGLGLNINAQGYITGWNIASNNKTLAQQYNAVTLANQQASNYSITHLADAVKYAFDTAASAAAAITKYGDDQ